MTGPWPLGQERMKSMDVWVIRETEEWGEVTESVCGGGSFRG